MTRKWHESIYTNASNSPTFKRLINAPEISTYYQELKGGNARTVYIYIITLGAIRKKLGKPLHDATRQDLIDILALLKQNPSKHNTFVSVMRDYYLHVLKRGFPKVGDKRFARIAEYSDELVMSDEQQQQFFHYLEKHPNPLWKCLFGAYAYSLRRGEGVYLYERQVDFDKRIITVKPTPHFTPKHMLKKSFDRYIKVSEKYLLWLKEWLQVRPEPIMPRDKALLFLNNLTEKVPGICAGKRKTKKHRDYGYPLSVWLVNREFKKLLQEAGLPSQFHPHTLRANFVTDLLDKGVSMKKVMLASGHQETKNLEKYWRIVDKKRAASEVDVEPSFISNNGSTKV